MNCTKNALGPYKVELPIAEKAIGEDRIYMGTS